jgi:hypothetical protein
MSAFFWDVSLAENVEIYMKNAYLRAANLYNNSAFIKTSPLLNRFKLPHSNFLIGQLKIRTLSLKKAFKNVRNV